MNTQGKTTHCGKGFLRLSLGLAMACTIAACSQPNSWTKPGVTEVIFDGDMAQCRHQAAEAAQSMQFGEAPGLEGSDRQDRLIRHCMEAKGYALSGK